jgi:hypothetical protein
MPSRIETMELQPARLEIRHQIPGRIRLHVPALRDDPLLSERLTQALIQIEGVRGVRWNPAGASLVVWHRRAGPLTQEELSQVLHPALQRVSSRRPVRIASSDVTPEAPRLSKALARLPSPARTPALVKTATNWRSWLERPSAWRRPLPTKLAEARTGSTLRPARPGCRLCQIKLTLARWIFADVWRCWTNELTTQQRPQAR